MKSPDKPVHLPTWSQTWIILLLALVASASGYSPRQAVHAAPEAATQGVYLVCKATNCTYKSIEAALAAAQAVPGPDMIQVVPGTFPEGELVISDVITVTGIGPEITVVQPASNMRSEGWITVLPGARLALDNLVLDGFSQGQISVKVGLSVSGELSLETVTLRNLNTLSTYSNGVHSVAVLLASAPGSGASSVRHSSFENIDSVGVLACGEDTILDFEHNTYVGKELPYELDLAVWVSGGAQASLQDNTIHGNQGIVGLLQSAAVRVDAYNELCPQGSQPSAARLTGNMLLDSQVGVWLGAGPDDASWVEAQFNRIATNGHGVYFNGAPGADLSLIHNWWGCSAGPGDTGCNDAFQLPEAYFTPWMTMRIQAEPTELTCTEPEAHSDILVDLRYDSLQVDTSSLGRLPDGIPAVFTSTLGTVEPALTEFIDSQTSAVFTPGHDGGIAIASINLDGEQLPVEIQLTGNTFLPLNLQGFAAEIIR